MARSAGLRAVKSTERAAGVTPSRKRPTTVDQAAKSGNHRELLVSMRDRIAKTVSDPECPPRDLAALTRRLQEIAKEIAAIDHRARQESAEGNGGGDEAWDSSVI